MPNAIEYIKQNLTKDKVIALLGSNGAMHIAENGNLIRCTCPLHGGHNPTGFAWNLENNLWYCHTDMCGGGDIFSFVADTLDLSVEHDFREVVRKTAEVLGIDIANLEMGERVDAHRRELRAWLEYASRGQKKTNMAFDMSKLGAKYVLNSYRNFTKETLDFFEVRYSQVFNRILVPIFNNEGQHIGASLRRINESESAKWLHRPKHINTREVIYNIHNIHVDYTTIVITEGCFDVMNLWQIGLKYAGATFGAHLTEEQCDIICSRFIDVILAYDADDAGKGATRKAIEMLKNKVNLRVLDLPSTTYHDPGEIPDMEKYGEIQLLKGFQYLEKYGR